MTNKITTITTKDQLTPIIAENQNVLIDFYADWCGPCRIMAPRFEKAASMFQTIKFVKVNVDEAEALKTEFHLTSIPTFIFLTNGAEIHRFSGALTEDSFTSLITKKFALTSD